MSNRSGYILKEISTFKNYK